MDFHYFGSTGYGWVVDTTRAGVLRKLARQTGRTLLAKQVKINGGLYAWTVKVHAPIKAHYAIDGYRPVGVETSEARHGRIVKLDGTLAATA